MRAIGRPARIAAPCHNLSAACLALALCLPFASIAAADAMRLNDSVEVTAETVTLGDLIDNAGVHAGKAVFQAPKPGETGYISTSRIVEAAREAGIAIDTNSAPPRITIVRLGRPIDREEIVERIRTEIEGRIVSGDAGKLVVELEGELPPTYVDANAQIELPRPQIDWSERNGKFRAEFALTGGTSLKVTGNAAVMTEISVPRADLPEGRIVGPNDLEARLVATSSIGRNTITDPTRIVGKEVRRRVQAGKAVQEGDVVAPLLVHRNQLVSIVLDMPGIKLRTEGKALADAGAGESIKVMNTHSKRIIDATPIAPGIVSVASQSGSGS